MGGVLRPDSADIREEQPMTVARLFAVLVLAAVLLAAVVVVVPLASGSGASSPAYGMMGGGTGGDPGTWCGGGIWNGTGAWGGTGMWGTGFGATWAANHPQAFQAWLDLMAAHRAALKTWYDTYKADPTSAAAQQALHDLWQTFWNDMKAFYQQYGNGATWTCPALDMWGGWDMMGGGMMGGGGSWDSSRMWGTGYGAGWMMGHPKAFAAWLHLRAKQQAGVGAWWTANSSAPTSTAAQTALTTMRSHHRAQIRSFFKHHGLSATKTRMRFGAGGWMGLGGMWGGWGW
jgi:hypothetical protein